MQANSNQKKKKIPPCQAASYGLSRDDSRRSPTLQEQETCHDASCLPIGRSSDKDETEAPGPRLENSAPFTNTKQNSHRSNGGKILHALAEESGNENVSSANVDEESVMPTK